MKSPLLSFYSGKKVFITGHTGFKGTWLCHILLQAGAEVTGYALEPPTSPSLFKMTNLSTHIKSIAGDIRDYETLEKAVRQAAPEVVFHLAAQPLVRLSYSEPVTTYATNVMGTVNLLEAVRKCESVKSAVNVTTDKVYENCEWLWGYRENENLCGYDPYSNSKSCSELVTYSYKNSFFCAENAAAISTARSGNVIGGGDFAPERIIPDCVRAAQKDETISLRNPLSIRPYQHVLECLGGYLLLAKKQYEDKSFCGSYNFGPNDESCVTTGELTALFCAKWGNGLIWANKSNPQDKNLHEANFLKLDCTKAKSVLGWKPFWPIEQAVEKTARWYREVLIENKNARELIETQIADYFGDRN